MCVDRCSYFEISYCNSPDVFVFFFCLACDTLQEQYELVYNAVLELFKRHMDIIGDEPSGREVMLKLYLKINYILFFICFWPKYLRLFVGLMYSHNWIGMSGFYKALKKPPVEDKLIWGGLT